MNSNVKWQKTLVSKEKRSEIKRQKPFVLWFTGLSGSGKSTIAVAMDSFFISKNYHSYILDGDNLRHGLNKDLDFSVSDREENIRRVGEVTKLFLDAGIIILASFISPFRKDREIVRNLFNDGEFLEIYLSTPIEVCETRDPKGLYKKAREGKILEFTGISSPYEVPINPEFQFDTSKTNVEEIVNSIFQELSKRAYFY